MIVHNSAHWTMLNATVENMTRIEPDDVTILMATHNGHAYIRRQMETIFDQSGVRSTIYVSDDGSTDGTREFLDAITHESIPVTVKSGPCRGFAENFRSLMTLEEVNSQFVAFSDQDDIWHNEKLQTAIAWLKSQGAIPALYCSRTEYVSENERHLGYSPRFKRNPHFRNALVQSLAGGNTMVMNRAAFDLVRHASRQSGFVSHDWWCYQVITGAGGRIHYADRSHISYRQHENNQVGSNRSMKGQFRRLGFLLKGGFATWSDQNVEGLLACQDNLTAESRAVLTHFIRSRRASDPFSRLYYLAKSGVYRQSTPGTAAMYLACFLGKI